MNRFFNAKQPKPLNAAAAERRRLKQWREACDLADLALMAGTPKITILKSIMRQCGLRVHTARAAYKFARKHKVKK